MFNYRFIIDGTVVNPREDGPLIKASEVSNEAYFKEAMDVELVFVNDEYQEIIDEDYTHTFLISYEYFDPDNETWTERMAAKFTKMDCEIDEERRFLVVSPFAKTPYDPIEKRRNEKFNLVKLGVPTQNIRYEEPGVLQVYGYGGTISNLARAYYNEVTAMIQEFNEESRIKLNDWGFSDVIDIVSHVLSSELYGGQYQPTAPGSPIFINANNYTLTNTDALTWQLRDPLDTLLFFGVSNIDNIPPDVVSDGTGTINIEIETFKTQSRLITNVSTLAAPYFKEDDPYINERYSRTYGVMLSNVLLTSNEYQDEPSDYGPVKGVPDKYYAKPTGAYAPLLSELWGKASFWIERSTDFNNLIDSGSQNLLIGAGFSLAATLGTIVPELNPDISFTQSESELFYGPSVPIGSQPRFFISFIPQSNIVTGKGLTPNQKPTMTYAQIMDTLKGTHQAYWYIGSDNKLYLEHLEWFERGKTYIGTQTDLDTTNLVDGRNNQLYSFRTNEYDHNKEDLFKSRLISASAEGGSFRDAKIVAQEDYAGDEAKSFTIPFEVDIERIIVENEERKDAWVMVATVLDGFTPTVPYVEYSFGGETLNAANGYLSPLNLVNNYHLHQLPTYEDVKINGTDVTPQSTVKVREHTYAVPYEEVDFYKLAITKVGTGRIKGYEEEYSKNQIEITERYVLPTE